MTRALAFLLGVAAVGSLIIPPPAGPHPLEPIGTELAVPTDPGRINLEVGYDFFRTVRGRTDATRHGPSVEIEWGAAHRVQLSVESAFAFEREREDDERQRRSGLEPVALGARYLIAAETRRRPDIALGVEVSPPSGSLERATEVEASLLVARTLAPRWLTLANVGYGVSRPEGETVREQRFVYNLALLYAASPHLFLVGEINGERRLDTRRHEDSATIAPEVIILPRHNVAVKVAVPVGVTRHSPTVGVRLQFNLVF